MSTQNTRLAINIGNTHTALGFYTAEGTLQVLRVSTAAYQTAEELAGLLAPLLPPHWMSPLEKRRSAADPAAAATAAKGTASIPPPARAIACSVVPQQSGPLAGALEALLGIPTKFITPATPLGLELSAYDTSLLGTDRVVAMAAALHKHGAPLLVCDLGTATTVNLVGPGGRFLGGAILPGLALGLQTLAGGTSLLPQLKAEGSIPLMGQNTAECLLSGSVIGTALALEGYAARVAGQYGWQPQLVLTGGGAASVLPHLGTRCIHEPELILHGLLTLAL